MRRLDLYIARHVLGATLLVLLVLSGLDILFTLIDELGDTNETYGAPAALLFVLMQFPTHLYDLLPMAALIGSLSGLGALASSNELVVLQCAGVGNARIVWSVMKPAMVIMVAGLVLGEWVAPRLQVAAEVRKSIINGEAVGLSRFGHWERDGRVYMHFDTIAPEGVLYGVDLFEFDDNRQLVRTVDAARAVFQGGGAGGANWRLEEGSERRFVRDGARIAAVHGTFETQPWQLDLTPDLLQTLIVDPDTMAMSDLYRYAERFVRQGQNADSYFIAFWKKLLQPLTTAALVFVGISFIFGPLREATMGSRLFTAICFGLGFTIVQRLLQTVSLVYQVAPLPAVVLPTLLCAGLGVLLFRRAT